MNQRYILATRDGTQYHLIQAGLEGPWTLVCSSGPGGQQKFRGLKQALHCLGGIVEWDAWSCKARGLLLALNGDKSI